MVRQNPFSIYDFLGYFIPGALVIFISIMILKGQSQNLQDILTTISSDKSFQLDNLLFLLSLATQRAI